MNDKLRQQELEVKEQELEQMYDEILNPDKEEVVAQPEGKPKVEAETTGTPGEVIKLEPEQKVAVEASAETQAVPEVAPDAAGEKFSALQQQYEDLRGWTTRASQKNAEVSRENDSLKKTLTDLQTKMASTPPTPSNTYNSIKDEYGEELAGKFQQLIREELGSVVTPITEELSSIRVADAAASTEALRAALPDNTVGVVNSPDFQLWLTKPTMLSVAQKEASFYSTDTDEAKRLLKQYAHERSVYEAKRNKKEPDPNNLKNVALATAEPKGNRTSGFELSVNKKPKYTVEQIAAMPAAEYAANRDEIMEAFYGATI